MKMFSILVIQDVKGNACIHGNCIWLGLDMNEPMAIILNRFFAVLYVHPVSHSIRYLSGLNHTLGVNGPAKLSIFSNMEDI